MKILDEYVKQIECHQTKDVRHLWVFDFDDTLVKTDAMIHVTSSAGAVFHLTPGEFAVYDKQVGDVFDYTDFQQLINPRLVSWMNRIFHAVCSTHGCSQAVILSARSYEAPIRQFLHEMGLDGVEAVALDSSDPNSKASWIDERIKRDSLKRVDFFDDSHKNVDAVKALQQQHPDVKIVARLIEHDRIASLLV